MSIDLRARYGSLTLRNPLIVGACPMTANEQNRVAIESAGAGAMVLPSLFEEQVVVWNRGKGRTVTPREESLLARAARLDGVAACPNAESYLALVNRASVNATIPIIASLNGAIVGHWLDFAGELEGAGAAAIELAVHPSQFERDQSASQVEDSIVELVSNIDAAITVPLFLKLGRQYTSLADIARRTLSGAQGLVLFGRQPEVDVCLDTLALKSRWGLTQPGSITESIASILRVHSMCPAMSIAACGGIGSAQDVVKAILAGADTVMVTSALYREGPDVIRAMNDGMVEFMNQHRFTSLGQMIQQRPVEFDSEAERLAYVGALSSRLEALGVEPVDPALEGDRFGHLERRGTDRQDLAHSEE